MINLTGLEKKIKIYIFPELWVRLAFGVIIDKAQS